MSITDLDILVLKCRNDEAKTYILEAIGCYKAGAYRACIAMTWVAVVYDVINKITELSLGGEPSAIKIKSDFDKIQAQITNGNKEAIKQSLEFEKDILVKATQLQLLGSQELSDLNRIKEDRNKSVHPSFNSEGATFVASPEQCRVHILHAVNHLLSNPPVQGKAALEQLKKLVLMEEFPTKITDLENAKKFLKDSPLGKATPALVKEFFNWIFFGFLTEGDPLYRKRKCFHCMHTVAELYPTFYLDHLTLLINKYFLEKVPSQSIYLAIRMLNEFPEVGANLKDTIKIRFENFIQQCLRENLESVISAGYNSNIFKDVVVKKVKTLSPDDLLEVVELASVIPEIRTKCIQHWCKSKSWEESNSRYHDYVENIVHKLSGVEVRDIVKSNADLIGSHAFKDFLLRVLNYGNVPRDTLEAILKEKNVENLLPSENEVSEYLPF